MSGSSQKLVISIAIVLIIGAHAVPLALGPAWRRTWPVLLWAMYKKSRPPGPIVAYKRRILVVSARGTSEEATPQLVGLGPPAMTRRYVRPMLDGDSSAARRLLDRLNRGRADPFVTLRVESERFTLTDDGVVSEALPPIAYRPARPSTD
ncbi:MAG TPA: hypothetical protein VMY76_13605 [Gemmatimonadales bacterium]|nr:hypothetical protein [Gemmatimonadales bacterium]